jgi:hypothetical protein
VTSPGLALQLSYCLQTVAEAADPITAGLTVRRERHVFLPGSTEPSFMERLCYATPATS